MGFSTRYTRIIDRIKIPVIIVWIVFAGFGAWLAPKFLTRTRNSFDPPPNCPAANADMILTKYFPELVGSSDFAVFVYSTNNQTLVGPAFQNFTLSLKISINNYPSCKGCILQYQGYYTIVSQDLPPQLSLPFLGPRNLTSIISLVASYSFTSQEAIDFATFVREKAQELRPPAANWEIELTGIPAFYPFMLSSIERDFALMDGIVLPIAVIILGLILKSVRLLILPLLCIATSAAVSFLIMYGISFWMVIISFAPSLMMSILVAMSIDYSLFLLTRYCEELMEGEISITAVQVMIASGGHTIFVSGITLTGCFLGLLILPLNMMQSLGISCAVTLLVILAVNLTMTPSLLLLFPNFFKKSVEPFALPFCVCRWGARGTMENPQETQKKYVESDSSMINESTHLIKDPGTISIAYLHETRERISASSRFWYTIGSYSVYFPINLIVLFLIVGITVPFDFHTLHYRTTDTMLMDLPNGASITDSYRRMQAAFGDGSLYPYRMLLIPTEPEKKIISEDFFRKTEFIVREMVARVPNTSVENFSGFVFGGGYNTWLAVDQCVIKDPLSNLTLCMAVRYAMSQFLNHNQTATFMYIRLGFEPIGTNGDAWYRRALSTAANLTLHTNISITFSGVPATSMDAVDAANSSFLTAILVTAGIVLVFVAISFRSLLLPFRSVLTIGLTLAWVYGFADMVYEHHLLDFLHFYGLKGWDAVHWVPPIVSFSIIVGIGLDYDIFLLVRIREFRLMGYSTKEAIALGITKTGHIITAAGIIMAIAFSGLLFSSVAVMNMLSFYMVFSVLFDTFLVRSLLVPALMSFLGPGNWWPGQVPNSVPSVIDYTQEDRENYQ